MSDSLPSEPPPTAQIVPSSPAIPESGPPPKTGAGRPRFGRYPAAWLVGLPAVLALLAILSNLFTPLETRQTKESGTLGGEGSSTLVYRLRLDQPQPQRLTLKLAGDAPVKIRLLRPTDQAELLTATPTPPASLDQTTLDLSGKSAEIEQAAAASSGEILVEMSFQGLRWQTGYWQDAPTATPRIFKGGLGQNSQPGDLYYRLEYAPNPGRLLSNFFQRQQTFGGLPTLALAMVAAALAVFFGGLYVFARRPGPTLQNILANRRGYGRYAGWVLALALAWCLAYMLVNPPLQGPDEPGHLGRSIGVGRGVTPDSLKPPVSQLMQTTNFRQSFEWLTGPDDPVTLFPPTAEFYQGPLYYSVGGLLVRLFKPSPENFTIEVYLARLASVFFFLGTVGASLVAGWNLRRVSPWLAQALPLTTAFWPQLLFLGSVSNNDNAAICGMAWAACGLLLLFKAGSGWRNLAILAAILVAGLGLGILAKRTAVSVLPGFGLGLVGWLLLRSGKRVKWAVAGVAAFTVVAVLVFLLIQTDTKRAARGWYLTPFSGGVHAPRSLGEGINGSAGLHLAERPVEQAVDLFFRPEVNHLYLNTNARSLLADASVTLKIELLGSGKPLVTGTVTLNGGEWREVALDTPVPAEVSQSRLSPYITVRFSIDGPGAAALDEIRLTARPNEGENLIINPGLEASTLSPASDWKSGNFYPGRSGRSWFSDTLDLMGNGRGLDFGDALLQSVSFALLSGWGTFGFGQVFLNLCWYLLWGLLTAGSIVGSGLLLRRGRLTARQVIFGLAALATVVLTFLLLQVYDYLALMYNGAPDIVAGRYMFVTWLFLALLFLAGLRGLIRPAKSGAGADGQTGRVMPGLGLWAWGGWLLVLNLVALVGTIFQFYYN